jgi:hypothetical protein
VERSARATVLTSDDVRNVLDAPLEAGMAGLLESEMERPALPNEPQQARELLEETIARYVEDIPDDSAQGLCP